MKVKVKSIIWEEEFYDFKRNEQANFMNIREDA